MTWLIIREASIRLDGFQNGPIICPVRLLTGFPCPGCGGTRAMGSICVGDFSSAWQLNPLAFVFVGIAIMWALKLTSINTFAQKISETFRAQALAAQVIAVALLYGIAWYVAIARFNSGIL